MHTVSYRLFLMRVLLFDYCMRAEQEHGRLKFTPVFLAALDCGGVAGSLIRQVGKTTLGRAVSFSTPNSKQ